MIINLNDIPSASKAYKIITVENETMLYSEFSEQAMLLNETSRIIWQLCDGVSTVGDIINMLIKAFPESDKEIQTSVLTTIETMLANSVITIN